MRRKPLIVWISLMMVLVLFGISIAQWQRGRYRGRSRGRSRDPSVDRNGVPSWEQDKEFQEDVFTFARVRYGGWSGWGRSWATDYPDSDLNFSYRLQQLTSLKVDPNGKVVNLSDDAMFDYPFLYLIEPGRGDLHFEDAEVENLRRYLYNGGFLMVDDFWGQAEWYVFYQQIKRVFPNREPQELPLEHEIFQIVYPLKEKPLIPSIGHFFGGQRTERYDAQEPHYRAIFDDNGRIMVMICHNTDLGDGWEREGEDPEYFHRYSEKWAYPLGINIVTYAMTH